VRDNFVYGRPFLHDADLDQIESLHELRFVERRENVIFLGPPGVGKTHLAISLAIAAAQSGRRVCYGAVTTPAPAAAGAGVVRRSRRTEARPLVDCQIFNRIDKRPRAWCASPK